MSGVGLAKQAHGCAPKQYLNWQLRCRRRKPVDRWLCVPIFRLVCPFSVFDANDNTNKKRRNLSQISDFCIMFGCWSASRGMIMTRWMRVSL
jgi:hypothetical protein